MLIAHSNAPFVLAVAAGVIDNLTTTGVYSLMYRKVELMDTYNEAQKEVKKMQVELETVNKYKITLNPSKYNGLKVSFLSDFHGVLTINLCL